MAEPSAATIYARQLIYQKWGYPLWDPDPQDEPAVEIADVGYVQNGAFVRLFNASKPCGDESNKLGVPKKYHPIQVGEIQKRTSLPANVPIQSESVVQLAAHASISAGVFTEAGGGFSFECSKEQGAVLLLGDDAERRDALRRDKFLRYILQNQVSWLAFANEALERGITLNDLVLVTGCDKTSAWACAAFSSKSSQADVSLNVGQMGVLQGSASMSWTWKHGSAVATHSGPRRPVPFAMSYLNDRVIQANETKANVPITEKAGRHDVTFHLASLSSNEGIVCSDVSKGAYDGPAFLHYIENLTQHMNPWLTPCSVLVMDNRSIHHVPKIADIYETRGVWLYYSPSYSLDFNPIVEAFSYVKSVICCAEFRAAVDAKDMNGVNYQLHNTLASITPEKALGWMRRAAYV